MGRAKRIIPEGLPSKLKIIRERSGLSLDAMTARLEQVLSEMGYPELRLYSGNIYEFEQGAREPMLPILAAYAQLANIYIDALVLKEFELPEELPSQQKSEGVRR